MSARCGKLLKFEPIPGKPTAMCDWGGAVMDCVRLKGHTADPEQWFCSAKPENADKPLRVPIPWSPIP